MIIVDTNVWSETVRPNPDPAVVQWISAHSADIAITSITVGELLYGVSVMPAGRRRDALATQVERLIVSAASRTLPYDGDSARELARIKLQRKASGKAISAPEDAMIAAIAAVHHYPVATRNVADFADMGVELINPWTYA